MHRETSAKDKSYPGKLLILLCFFAAIIIPLVLIGISDSVYAENDGNRGFLKKGKDDLEAGRYADAVNDLSAAEEESPLLGDYTLFYLSDAYSNLGDHKKSSAALRTLLEKYPQSPLTKKARLNEIREAKENSDTDLMSLFEAFLKEYPEEEAVGMMYGSFLKQKGDGEKASSLFKEIYVRAGSLSGAALEQLKPAEIKASDLIERASNLMKRFEFRSAEQDLRKALSMDEGKTGMRY